MRLLGAHMSIAGGYYLAIEAAAALGMNTCQIFTKNNNQWTGKPLLDSEIRQFKEACQRLGVRSPCAHDSYLINIGSPDPALWQKSLDALVIEIERAEALGLEGVVMHPGSYIEGDEKEGLKRIVRAIDVVHQRTRGVTTSLWLETTAGQGTNLGHRFEHIGFILKEVSDSQRLGVCVDTCHIFAAGYPLQTSQEYDGTMQQLDEQIGISRVRAFHLNDSLKDFGSRVDRHAHIGEGKLGLEPFRHVMNDRRFAEIPMYLETPKETREGRQLDEINLETLRGLIGKPAAPTASRTLAKQASLFRPESEMTKPVKKSKKPAATRPKRVTKKKTSQKKG